MTHASTQYSVNNAPVEAKQLTKLAAKSRVIQLDFSNFFKYVMNPNKEYSFVVLFTPNVAEDELSRQIYFELRRANRKIQLKSDSKCPVYFGVVDIEKDSAILKYAKICFRRDTGTIISKDTPMILHFPPSSKRMNQSDYIDLEDINKDMINKIIEIILTVWNESLKFLHARSFWAYASVALCIVLVSGNVWNDIHRPGLFYSIDGQTLFLVANGIQQQTVAEVIIFVTGMLQVIESFCIVIESEKKPKSKILRDGDLGTLGLSCKIIIGIGLVYGSFLVLLYTFHIKING